MDVKKIAIELVKIVKGLISKDIAISEGKYKKFTGKVDYEGSKSTVKNATFELKKGKIIWEIGIWKDGVWKDGDWEDGIWERGIWHDGCWKNGFWKDGVWNDGRWEEGTWLNGIWKDGRWEKGEILDVNRKGNFEQNWKWFGKLVISPKDPGYYFNDKS